MSRKTPTGPHVPDRSYTRLAEKCPACGKFSYPTRGDAKQCRKQMPRHKGLKVYPCPVSDNLFHLGHLPTDVLRGEIGREEIRHRRASNSLGVAS